MTPATPCLFNLAVPLAREGSFTRLVANRIARVLVMVRLSTAGAVPEVIEGVAAPQHAAKTEVVSGVVTRPVSSQPRSASATVPATQDR